ncbi:DNA-protecting protein DprA [Candidatus Parcubacteria bacterium]|nr:DNA-protecting protein DprA [Candidatus Parcubacteria bacterium]
MNTKSITKFNSLIENIPDKPKKLFYEGNIDLLDNTHIYVCIVGPRKATPYGMLVTEHIVQFLKDFNVVTVSGAAYGIDGLVHTLSIKHEIKTVAIPGSGISDDFFYPRAHIDLKHEILDHGGLIVNEFEPDTRSSHWTFPVRNRLMAGISHMTIVIEAEERSGTLITANLAADYNRDILAVPGNIFSRNSYGTNELINKGAKIFVNLESLREMLVEIGDCHDIKLTKE